jgi:hypothetical protein
MTSSKKIEANRRNAQKSTGPRTESGKAHSSRNAIQAGIYSEVLLLPNEDERKYDEIAEAIDEEFEPVGIQSEIYAAQLAGCIWRLGRLQKAEKVEFVKAQSRMHLQDNCGIQMHRPDNQGVWHREYDDPHVEKKLRAMIGQTGGRDGVVPHDLTASAESDGPPTPKLPPLGCTLLESYAPRSENAYAELDRLQRKYVKNIEHFAKELHAAKERRIRDAEVIDVPPDVASTAPRRARSKRRPKGSLKVAVADVPATASRPRNQQAVEPQLNFDVVSAAANSITGGATAPPTSPPH